MTTRKKMMALPDDYNNVKLKYLASIPISKEKKKTNLRPTISNKGGDVRSTTSSTRTAVHDKEVTNTLETKSKLKSESHASPVVCSGLNALGHERPLDNKYEFGLSRGIQAELTENIKLCGLRRGRENFLLNMVATLCNHLSERVEFANTVAEKLTQSRHEREIMCKSRDNAHEYAKLLREGLMGMQEKMILLKEESKKISEDVAQEMILTSNDIIKESNDCIKRYFQIQLDSVMSRNKSEMHETIENLIRENNDEKQRMEATIHGLKCLIKSQDNSVQSLQQQLNCSYEVLKKEKNDGAEIRANFELEAVNANNKLAKAHDEIMHLKQLLEHEKTDKNRCIDDVEEKMKCTLEAIDRKVKRSFNAMIDSKNREIEQALQRAREAEASAKIAENVLSELKANLLPIITTAECTHEN